MISRNHVRFPRFILRNISCLALGVMLLMLAAPSARAEQEPVQEKQPPKKTLDQKLLDDLDSELFEGLQEQAPDSKPAAASDALDQKLLDQLGEGEDVGAMDPLSKIARRMKLVEERIGSSDTSRGTQDIQREIIEDLSALIDLQAKKCKGQSSGGSKSQAGKAAKPAGKKQGDQPSRDSTNRLGQAKQEEMRLDDVREMLKRVWGHLPPRLREQIQSASIEEFLPKYEKLIEQYYERLSEQND